MQLPMSGLPPKPEVSRTASSWPEPTDDRRYVGRPVPMAGPDHYRPRRDDRDRDRDRDRERDRDRGRERDRDRDRSYHPPRSPPPRSPRGRDTYTSPSRNDTHREYYHRDERPRGERGWEPDRRASERRDDRAWTRDEHTGRGRGRGRGRVSPRRGNTYRGGGGSWRGRDSERDRDYGGRGRSREYDRNHHDRRRFDDRERSSMHRAPYSPRQDSNERRREHYSPVRSPRRSYSPRRHSRPPSPDGSTHRHSSRSPVKREPGHSPRPPSAPRSRYSDHRGDDRRRGSHTPSPRPSKRSLSQDVKPEPTHEETHLPASPTHSQRSLRAPGEKPATKSASPYAKAESNDDLHHVQDVKVQSILEDARSPASSPKAKEESADQDAEGDFKMRDRSPHPPSHSPYHAIKTPPTPASPAPSFKHPIPEDPSGDMPRPPTAPFLPPFTRRETLKERLGQKYKDELSQIEAIEASRSRAASEQVQNSKAVRRALHELDLTTIDLRAAQIRREHAENHRKKAASANGFFDFEAEFPIA